MAISNAGVGTIPHIAAAALGERTGTSFAHIPYQGSSPAILGLLSGDVQATTVAYAELRQHVDSGKLKTLAVMAEKRVAGLDAPTLKERGVPLEFSVWRGIGVPKGAPKEAVAAWSAAARKLATDPAFQATIAKQSLTLAIPDAPEFSAAIARQNEAFKVVLMSRAKGSSSSSSVIAEAIRARTAPAAIVMLERDLIVALGGLVASELYGTHMPAVVVDDEAWKALSTLGPETSVEISALDDRSTISVLHNPRT